MVYALLLLETVSKVQCHMRLPDLWLHICSFICSFIVVLLRMASRVLFFLYVLYVFMFVCLCFLVLPSWRNKNK